ncbi:glucuronate isomerase [Streptococcus sp. NLN76]|uniref:glucuronate isomerase n=1 Tax=Streptococcus sp. NLN76 TaxID=2822800 RepID=UPI0018A9F741|nr:glucuronate isomerase [Streptococcus sp. NLN76]MBF8969503.1 glucuronate isomerase [Streptococcus sp. NLN76]
MSFFDENFMLKNSSAIQLYQSIKKLPIYDFHCHLDPREIFEDKVYDDIVDLWLGGDHYKWRLMRANGISEYYITGEASNLDKFIAWASTLEVAYGNPLYHWSHLELRNVFGINELLTKDNAEEMYDRLNSFIQEKSISPRKLIAESNVEFIGTTDGPLDSLEWHQKLSEDASFDTIVAPTFRPDQAFVEHQEFAKFTARLEEMSGKMIHSYTDFISAMGERIAFFAKQGCRASDISFLKIVYRPVDTADLNQILAAAREGNELSQEAIEAWQTALFRDLCRFYKQYDFVTQVHFGALRNNHSYLAQKLGADVGVDSMGDQINLAFQLNRILDDLVQEEALPKMIWYNLNPNYNHVLANTLANFQANEKGQAAQLQLGAGWWFNDTRQGMIQQMDAYAEQGILAHFVGMLTDSRSFLSYQRHDYFRRILASYIGHWVEEGEVPEDYPRLEQLVKAIAFNNAQAFFRK